MPDVCVSRDEENAPLAAWTSDIATCCDKLDHFCDTGPIYPGTPTALFGHIPSPVVVSESEGESFVALSRIPSKSPPRMVAPSLPADSRGTAEPWPTYKVPSYGPGQRSARPRSPRRRPFPNHARSPRRFRGFLDNPIRAAFSLSITIIKMLLRG